MAPTSTPTWSASASTGADVAVLEGEDEGRMETMVISDEYPKYRSWPFSSVVSRVWPVESLSVAGWFPAGERFAGDSEGLGLALAAAVTGRKPQSLSIFS